MSLPEKEEGSNSFFEELGTEDLRGLESEKEQRGW
jgi:hypothetical protein